MCVYIYKYIYIYYKCIAVTVSLSGFCDRPNAVYCGECSISVIELLYKNE